MLPFRYLTFIALVAVAYAQDFDNYGPPARPAPARVQPGYSGPSAAKPTPVAILKQINRHNEDGSYTYGYESADGSFKIETKDPSGTVKGKYGYTDDTGKVRVVEYGATKYGFEPAGEGITVAPPTLVDETTNKDGVLLPEYSGAYYDQDQQEPERAAPRPRPQSIYTPQYSAPQQFEPSPVPQRAQVSGAAPVEHGFSFEIPTRAAPSRSFAPAPQRSYAPTRSFAPAPPRPQIPNAAPAPIEEYEPAPQRPLPKITYAQPAPLSAEPEQSYAPRPAQSYAQRPAQSYQPRPSPTPVGQVGRGGILDQLSKDYALPAGGAAPLHDITFGYY